MRAEAYARVSGRPGVVVTTSGPGLTNAMTAAATAYAESQPVLLLSSGMPTGAEGRDIGQLHEAKNVSGAMDQLVAWSRRVGDADEAASAVSEAFSSFTGRRPRPVHIEIPVDVLEQTWTGEPRIGTPSPRPRRTATPFDALPTCLSAADRPLIIAGGGAVDAQAELTALAEALGAPVATTVNGKGTVDEAHPLSVGASVRLRALQKAAADSDALLLVGTELGDSDLWAGQIRGQVVIRCDIDPAQLDKNCPADHALLGDAAATLNAVFAALPTKPAGGEQRAAALRTACREEAAVDADLYAEINAAVRAALPADAVLTGDSSQVTYFGSVHFFDLPAPRRFCYSPGFATLGYGLPAGLGAVDRTARCAGRHADRRRGADVLGAGTDHPCGTRAFGAGDRRGQRRLPRDPGPGGRARHPADRCPVAHPGPGRARRRDGRPRRPHHLDRRSTRPGRCRPRRRRSDPHSFRHPLKGLPIMDIAVVVIYLVGMIAFGFWGKRKATTQSDFLVAGRRLGPMLYSGTMAAIVLGGASTIGGVGLGYEYGISGMWLVVAIGVGILLVESAVRGPDPAAGGLHRQPDARTALRSRLFGSLGLW